MAIRLALLAHHYRSDWAWTPHGLEGAVARLDMWRSAVKLNETLPAEPVLERVREVLSDDLKTPSALDAVDNWARQSLTTGGNSNDGPLVAALCNSLLGVEL